MSREMEIKVKSSKQTPFQNNSERDNGERDDSRADDVRAAVVAAGRRILATNLVVGTWGNLSQRDPDGRGFWITPSGMDYGVISEGDLVLLNLDARVLAGTRKPSTEAAMHAAIYRARPDVAAVIHTHSLYASACAAARRSIPPIVEDAAQLLGGAVEVAEYALPGTADLAAKVVLALGTKYGVLLANHGSVGVGKDLHEAILSCQLIEKAATIFVLSHLVGGPVALDSAEVDAMARFYREQYGQK